MTTTTGAQPRPTSERELEDVVTQAEGTRLEEASRRPEPEAEPEAEEEVQVPEVVGAACRFAAARGRPAAVFILAAGNLAEGTPDVPITAWAVSRLASALGEGSHFDDLDLVIHSSGGDIHAAYRMMSFLRRRMTGRGELVTCVPWKAQSSATLLCLGADRIMLDELATLGPLDAQIKVGLTDVGTPDYTSALHLLKGLTRLREFSLETLEQAAAMLYDKRVGRNDDIVRYAIEFSRGVTAPLFDRIESHKIGYWDQMLRTGEAYGRRLLRRGKLVEDRGEDDPDEKISGVVRRLVNDYPSHEYVIDCEELADKLGLKAGLFEGDERSTARALAECTSDTLLMLVYPPTAAAPAEMRQAREVTLRGWRGLDGKGSVESVRWTSKESGTFLMRIGLYHRPLKASRNPWRASGKTGEGSPSEQYFTGVGPGW